MEADGQDAARRLRNPNPSSGVMHLLRSSQRFVSSDFSFPLSSEQPWRIQVEMPSLGKSHHWTKNHTATKITNSNRSFIVILPWVSRFAAGVHAPAVPVIR
jgi:hypothetical protein